MSLSHLVTRKVGFFTCVFLSSLAMRSAVSRDGQTIDRALIRRSNLYSPLRHAQACQILSRAKRLVLQAFVSRSDLASAQASRPTPIAAPRTEAHPRMPRFVASLSKLLGESSGLRVSAQAWAKLILIKTIDPVEVLLLRLA